MICSRTALSLRPQKMTDAPTSPSRECLISFRLAAGNAYFPYNHPKLCLNNLRKKMEDKNAAAGLILTLFPKDFSCLFFTVRQRKRNSQVGCHYTPTKKTPNQACLSFPS